MAQKSTIGALKCGAYHPVYRRSGGSIWIKVNETGQAPAKKNDDHWVIAGNVTGLEPSEEVEVLHFASEEVAWHGSATHLPKVSLSFRQGSRRK